MRSPRGRVAVVALAWPLIASASAKGDPPPLSVGAETGAGTMLAEYQRNRLGERFALQGSLRVGLAVAKPLAAQLVLRDWWFPSSRGYGRSTLVGAGVRYEPIIGAAGRLWLDGDGGLGLTGSATRFAFDFGVGFDLAVTRALGLGPFVRYGQLLATAVDFPSDAKYWSAGISITARFLAAPPPPSPPVAPPPIPTPPPDGDGDGVPDGEDRCPHEAAGEHPDPDPLHHGCPERDVDADGVLDHLDHCPSTPAGPHPDSDRAGCPDGDDDNDGVLNHADDCPTQAHGLRPDPARPGCPAADRDGDSVPDVSDACPDKPGAPNPDPAKSGCPGMVRVEVDRITINQPVYFATDKDRILPRSFPVLRAIADALRATPEIKRISIDGHADVRGTTEYNLDLSRRRAANIRAFLIEQGIEAERLESRGFGNTRPADTNETEGGRARNRRVEFIIVDPKGSAPEVRP